MVNHIVSMRGICKSFETERVETRALHELALDIRDGEFLSVSGPSGGGKSTLLSLLGLLDKPSSGQYTLDGINVSELSKNRAAEIRCTKLGFVFQSFNLIDNLSVQDNVGLPLHYLIDAPDIQTITEKVKYCLEVVGLSHRAEHMPGQLSGGQQQRVAIARAIVADPKLLLVDEPTGNLDSSSGEAIMALFKELNEKGTTICMVTHDRRYADMAKRKLVLKDGILELYKCTA